MWQLLAAMILTTAGIDREVVTIRVENYAGCAVRVQVMQRGAVRQTLFVENSRTITEAVRVPTSLESLSFRIIGIGCPFARYMVEPINHFETSLVLQIHSIPTFSSLMPYRLPR
jgi:hypothetical protein